MEEWVCIWSLLNLSPNNYYMYDNKKQVYEVNLYSLKNEANDKIWKWINILFKI